jgi:hypothetical protein
MPKYAFLFINMRGFYVFVSPESLFISRSAPLLSLPELSDLSRAVDKMIGLPIAEHFN